MSAAEAPVRMELLRKIQMGSTSVNTPSSGGVTVWYPTDTQRAGSLSFSAGVRIEPTAQVAYAEIKPLVHSTFGPLRFPQRHPGWTNESLQPKRIPVGSPFDELRSAKLLAAQMAIADFTRQLQGIWPQLVARLTTIVEATAEEYPESDIPTPQTIRSCLQFFAARPDLRGPALTATPSGNIWAEWRGAEGRRAALEFLRNGSLNLIALYPDEQEPWRMASFAANVSRRDAAEQIQPQTRFAWLLA